MCAGWACVSSGNIRFNDFLEAQACANIWPGLITIINDVKPAHVQPFILWHTAIMWFEQSASQTWGLQVKLQVELSWTWTWGSWGSAGPLRLDPGDEINHRQIRVLVSGWGGHKTRVMITLPVTVLVKKTGRFPFFWILTLPCKLYVTTEYIIKPIKCI